MGCFARKPSSHCMACTCVCIPLSVLTNVMYHMTHDHSNYDSWSTNHHSNSHMTMATVVRALDGLSSFLEIQWLSHHLCLFFDAFFLLESLAFFPLMSAFILVSTTLYGPFRPLGLLILFPLRPFLATTYVTCFVLFPSSPAFLYKLWENSCHWQNVSILGGRISPT